MADVVVCSEMEGDVAVVVQARRGKGSRGWDGSSGDGQESLIPVCVREFAELPPPDPRA